MEIALYIIFCCVVWLVQNVIHESSHLIAAKLITKTKILSFKPYPHKQDKRWVFASCEYKILEKDKDLSLIHIAPLITDNILLFFAGIFYLIFENIYFIPFIITSFIDFLFFWYTYFWGTKYSDGQKWRNRQ